MDPQSVRRINHIVNEFLDPLRSGYAHVFLKLFLILYAGTVAYNLPKTAYSIFGSPLVKILVLYLIIWSAKADPFFALITAVGMYVLLNIGGNKRLFEAFGAGTPNGDLLLQLYIQSAVAKRQTEQLTLQPPSAATTTLQSQVQNSVARIQSSLVSNNLMNSYNAINSVSPPTNKAIVPQWTNIQTFIGNMNHLGTAVDANTFQMYTLYPTYYNNLSQSIQNLVNVLGLGHTITPQVTTNVIQAAVLAKLLSNSTITPSDKQMFTQLYTVVKAEMTADKYFTNVYALILTSKAPTDGKTASAWSQVQGALQSVLSCIVPLNVTTLAALNLFTTMYNNVSVNLEQIITVLH